MNEKCPEIVIEYYESRCPINQKCENNERVSSRYESESIENPPPIVEKPSDEPKATVTESVTETPSSYPDDASQKPENADNDVVNAAFSINVDDTNSVQVSYSLPLIENQPGEELMETQLTTEQGSRDTSNCHMPSLQDVEMQ